MHKRNIFFLLFTVLVMALLLFLKYQFSYFLASSNSGIGGISNYSDTDVLFIGSSHTRQSYDMHIIEDAIHTDAYALAYDGLTPALMYPLLEYVLNELEFTPRLLVVEAYVYATIKPPALQDTRLFFDSPPSLKTRYWHIFNQQLNKFDWRDKFQLLVSANNERILTYPIAEYFYERGSYRGGYRNKTTNFLDKISFERIKPSITGAPRYALNDYQVAGLKTIFGLLKQRGINAIFVESPMPSNVERDAFTQLNKQSLRNLVESGGFSYIDGAMDFDVDNPKNFADSNHLSTYGRAEFSRSMATKIARHFVVEKQHLPTKR